MPTDKLKVLLLPDETALATAGYDLAPDPDTGRREVSGPINGAVRRYAAVVERGAAELAPVLSRADWNALADANNGCADLWDHGAISTPPLLMFWANLADSPGIGEKWGIDAADLIRRLQALAPHHGEAILAAIRWAWDHPQAWDHQADEWWTPVFRRKAARE